MAIFISAPSQAGLFDHGGGRSRATGKPRALEHSLRRAGNPQRTSPLAHPTASPAYETGYVGGGAAFGGEARTVEDGTWGRDFTGQRPPRRVFLRWSHGRRYQGGTGSYRTDGPPPASGAALRAPGALP